MRQLSRRAGAREPVMKLVRKPLVFLDPFERVARALADRARKLVGILDHLDEAGLVQLQRKRDLMVVDVLPERLPTSHDDRALPVSESEEHRPDAGV